MVNKLKVAALVGVLALVGAPAFAQDLELNPLGLPLIPNSTADLPIIGGGAVDLDPFHIFTPEPAPAAAPAPMKKHYKHHKKIMHKMKK